MIRFYVSGHGFGHAVRQAEVCRALLELAPDARVEVRTMAPAWLFPVGVRVVARGLDLGVVQPDSLRVRATDTLARFSAMMAAERPLIEAEASEARDDGVRLVVADIPSAAFAIADRARVPGVGVANFSWDWIYEEYVRDAPEYGPVLAHLRAQYGMAELLLRLPFHGDFPAFRQIRDVPLVARRAAVDRRATRRRLGLPLETPLILLSFGGLGLAGLADARLDALGDYAFVATDHERPAGGAGNLFVLPRDSLTGDGLTGDGLTGDGLTGDGLSYVDLLAACDAVVTKLGYGIVADCLANRVPMLYVPRGSFLAEAILIDGVAHLGRAAPLARADLDRWDLGPALDGLLADDRPWADVPLDGAEVTARHLLELAGARSR